MKTQQGRKKHTKLQTKQSKKKGIS